MGPICSMFINTSHALWFVEAIRKAPPEEPRQTTLERFIDDGAFTWAELWKVVEDSWARPAAETDPYIRLANAIMGPAIPPPCTHDDVVFVMGIGRRCRECWKPV